MKIHAPSSEQGITLTETIVVASISGLLATFAIPAYQDMIERNRLRQAVESFKSDLQLARTEAIKRSQNVVVSRKTGDAGTWCYGLTLRTASKTSCDCEVSDPGADNFCDIKRIIGENFAQTNLEAATINNNTFSFRRGTINAGGATFSTQQYIARVVVSDVGRVRLCRPNPLPAGKTALPNIQSAC
ncbi:MAG: GspH/FimT family pseudopilin [Methylomonas sp.]|nr:GspH/FimT family pseudopilin [Methylomonas sp.]